MKAHENYLSKALEALSNLKGSLDSIDQVAHAAFQSMKDGNGVLHLFGSGHSHMIVEEAFHRAGGLIPVNAMLEEYLMPHATPSRNGPLERLTGLAGVIADYYGLKAGEVIVIISNSGINATSIEMAMVAREKGLRTVAITNLKHSSQSKSRHASGKRLFELCDYVIDTGGVKGDACLQIPGVDVPVGPLSTMLGISIINMISVRIAELFAENGLPAPVYLSANLPGGDERNKKLEAQYKSRIPRLVGGSH